MAEVSYHECDCCGKQVPKEHRLLVPISKDMSPSGNGYEVAISPVDLCHACLTDAVRRLLASDQFNEHFKLSAFLKARAIRAE